MPSSSKKLANGEKRLPAAKAGTSPYPHRRSPPEGLVDRIAERQRGIVTLDPSRRAGLTGQTGRYRI